MPSETTLACDFNYVRPPKLYINHVAEYDWLIALEFGRVDDAQPPGNWRGVTEGFGYLYHEPDGRPLGFKVIDFSEFDPESPEVAEIWGDRSSTSRCSA